MTESKRVAIVGAGITGLSCAAALRGHARVAVVDRIPVAGGVHGWLAAETAELVASCGAELRVGMTALRWDGRELLAIGQDGAVRIPAAVLVVATGRARSDARSSQSPVRGRPASSQRPLPATWPRTACRSARDHWFWEVAIGRGRRRWRCSAPARRG
jgi:predicted NAD/FAD-dependent oxidoreductase